MNRLILLVTAVWMAAMSLGETIESGRAREARLKVTDQVKEIDAEGLPGPVMCLSEDAFAIGQCQHYEGTKGFAGAGAFYGKGRIIYLGHPAYLTGGEVADTHRLIKNSIAWLGEGLESPRIVAFRDKSILAKLKTLGFSPIFLADWSEVQSNDIIVTIDWQQERVGAMVTFVREGGRILGAGLGWGWKQFMVWQSKPSSLAMNFPDNQVIGAMGILMGDMGTNRPDGWTHYPILDEYPEACYTKAALRKLNDGSFASAEEKRQCLKIATLTVEALPENGPEEVRHTIERMLAEDGANKQPTRWDPIGPGDIAAKVMQVQKKNLWQSALEKVWPADPAHVSYPGAVEAGSISVKQSLCVDCAVPKWHSTGLYAPAGAPLTIKLPEAACGYGLAIRVGTSTEDLTTTQEKWKRAPLVSMALTLNKRETRFSSPYGGLIYLVVPEDNSAIDRQMVEVEIDGAIKAPYFKLGKMTNEEFLCEAAESKAPMGELEGESMVITLPTAVLRKVKDAEGVMKFWDEVLEGDRKLAGWPPRRYKERFCGDLQLECGFMHNGYPMMFHLSENGHEDIVDLALQRKGGGWGYYHEIGHNHQSDAWTPEGTGEVTCNIFTTFVIQEIAKQNFRENRFEGSSAALQAQRVRNWVRGGKTHEAWKDDYFLALELYLRIAETYGFETYRKVFAKYRECEFVKPRTNTEKWNTFARVLSEITGDNLAEVFEAWNLPIDNRAKTVCRDYRQAPAALTKGVAITDVLAIVTTAATEKDSEWRMAADALVMKHIDEAKIIRISVQGSITNVLGALAKAKPTHVAFVMKPEEVSFADNVAIKRMMRDLNNDPYDDAIWGIVTGPDAASVLRIASSPEPKEIRSVLATTGVDDDVVPGPLVCLSDAYPEGCWRVKEENGVVTRHSSSNDVSHVFADGWNKLDPNLIVTASHASQRNLEMPFSRGNIVPIQGRFATCPDLRLIDYRTGQAKEGIRAESAYTPLKEPQQEKIWLAAGNCLIADNLRPGENMIMTALGFGKVNQFVGYMSTTWFGEIGWTTWKNFREGMSFVEAYFAANRALVQELEETVTNANRFRPVFASARDYDRLLDEVRRFKFAAKGPITDQQKFVGRLWDRDATIFYGDPMQKVYLKRK